MCSMSYHSKILDDAKSFYMYRNHMMWCYT
jgi:hypothetical protein